MLSKSSLALQTKAFWTVSKAFNGQHTEIVTVEKALQRLNNVLNNAPYRSRVAKYAETLKDTIIDPPAKSTKIVPPSHVSVMRNRIEK